LRIVETALCCERALITDPYFVMMNRLKNQYLW
jgi:hypothetical protein